MTSIHPGVTREQIEANTGWPVRYAANVAETPAPTAQELDRSCASCMPAPPRAHGEAA